jgi:SAM-dependent methyltransferase
MYYLPENYRENKFNPSTNYDDTGCEDEYQDEVYSYAKNRFLQENFASTLDIGCGSGFKLIKYFNNSKTTGLEIGATLEFLKGKYPDKSWMKSDFDRPPEDHDLIICSDVIEHLKNPEDLLSFISKMNFKLLVISTPDRDKVQSYHFGRLFNGPPSNREHVREWNSAEFKKLIQDHFHIEEQFLCKSHRTHSDNLCQVVVARKKDDQ